MKVNIFCITVTSVIVTKTNDSSAGTVPWLSEWSPFGRHGDADLIAEKSLCEFWYTQWCCSSGYFSFPLSESFHQRSILVLQSITDSV